MRRRFPLFTLLAVGGLVSPMARADLPPWPAEVTQALQRAQVPPEAVSLVIAEAAGPSGPVRAQWQPERPMNPASLFKLVTTYAALDLLGPAWTWRTPVWLDGPLQGDTLEGSLVLQGRGDPKLVAERVWQLLRRLRESGVRTIRGDIVLDRSAFAPPTGQPGDFDGEPLRLHNVQADALLLSYKSLSFTFTPDVAAGVARISTDVPLDGVTHDLRVPLADGPCTDWRAALQANFDDPKRARFAGRYAATCGERSWTIAHGDPAGYNARLLKGLWRELDGRLVGRVRDGTAPAARPPSFELVSPPLAEVVRDINKYSNNVAAQQLFLTLARERGSAAGSGAAVTPEAARETLRGWLRERVGDRLGDGADGAVIDNGSGLSRDNRLSARLLALLLQQAFASPVMPELMASLPVAGVDGTMRRSSAAGRAHLKSGSLRDVAAVAGYVLPSAGPRLVLVAMVQHPNAGAARPALDALVQWALAGVPATR